MTLALNLPTEVLLTVERMSGRAVESVRPVMGGFTQAHRAVVRLSDGRSLFVKAASDAPTHAWLEAEWAMYNAMQGTASYDRDDAEVLGFRASAIGEWNEGGVDCPPFMPHVVGYSLSPQLRGVLLLEDLSDAVRTPPWTAQQIDAVLRNLDLLHKTPKAMRPRLPRMRDARAVADAWKHIAANPEPALKSGVIDAAWWRRFGHTLAAMDGAAVLDGDALLHADIRADNLMFCGARPVFVDWNWACIGNPAVDVAGWLPSLLMQGGRLPDDRLIACGPQIALLAGYFLGESLRPELPHAPTLRTFQRDQFAAVMPLVSAWLSV
jgi:hypothetical protein